MSSGPLLLLSHSPTSLHPRRDWIGCAFSFSQIKSVLGFKFNMAYDLGLFWVVGLSYIIHIVLGLSFDFSSFFVWVCHKLFNSKSAWRTASMSFRRTQVYTASRLLQREENSFMHLIHVHPLIKLCGHITFLLS